MIRHPFFGLLGLAILLVPLPASGQDEAPVCPPGEGLRAVAEHFRLMSPNIGILLSDFYVRPTPEDSISGAHTEPILIELNLADRPWGIEIGAGMPLGACTDHFTDWLGAEGGAWIDSLNVVRDSAWVRPAHLDPKTWARVDAFADPPSAHFRFHRITPLVEDARWQVTLMDTSEGAYVYDLNCSDAALGCSIRLVSSPVY